MYHLYHKARWCLRVWWKKAAPINNNRPRWARAKEILCGSRCSQNRSAPTHPCVSAPLAHNRVCMHTIHITLCSFQWPHSLVLLSGRALNCKHSFCVFACVFNVSGYLYSWTLECGYNWAPRLTKTLTNTSDLMIIHEMGNHTDATCTADSTVWRNVSRITPKCTKG